MSVQDITETIMLFIAVGMCSRETDPLELMGTSRHLAFPDALTRGIV